MPHILTILHRSFPKWRTDIWNVSFFLVALLLSMELSVQVTHPPSLGDIMMYRAYRHHFEYKYVIFAAFDAGFDLNMLLMFFFLERASTSRCQTGGEITSNQLHHALR
ncbi:hypothetical protein N7490_005615 [Penicillium lividum]|nr:hypothetical protein N7490_005615 [Penicillium lividum]